MKYASVIASLPRLLRADDAADYCAGATVLAELRARVLAVLRSSDATADECAAVMRESVLAVRPRLTELARLGQIADSGVRRANASGRMAVVWEVCA